MAPKYSYAGVALTYGHQNIRTRSRHLRMGLPIYATNYGFFISFRTFYVTLDLFRFDREKLRNIRKPYVGDPSKRTIMFIENFKNSK